MSDKVGIKLAALKAKVQILLFLAYFRSFEQNFDFY